MYRLLIFVFSIVLFAPWQPATAASNHVVELGRPTNASLQTIGKKPPKRFIQLDLGNMRTRSALLPDGERDLKARIRLRNRRALERQRAKPKRKSKKKIAKADAGKPGKDQEGVNENEVQSEKSRKKIAQASKKKRKKRRKKRGSRRNGGGSGKRPALNANPSRPVSIN